MSLITDTGNVLLNSLGIGQKTNFQDWINQQASYLIKPVTAKGIGGFIFSVRDEEQIELKSEVTDYAIEDNSTIQDHIAIKPVVVSLRGFVGEIVNEVYPETLPLTSTIENRLTELSTYTPLFSTQSAQTLSKVLTDITQTVNDINNLVNKAQNLVSNISAPLQTKQQQAYNVLKSMWQTKQIFTLETPWEYLDNMVISSLTATQDKNTLMVTDFSLTLKQLRLSRTLINYSMADIAAKNFAEVINKSQLKNPKIGLTELDLIHMKSSDQKNVFDYIGSN